MDMITYYPTEALYNHVLRYSRFHINNTVKSIKGLERSKEKGISARG